VVIAKLILAAVIGYLLGSIPIGIIVGKTKAKIDIRDYGSGRTGGTNVLRTLGKKAFVIVAAGDLLKSALAVFLAGLIMGKDSSLIWHVTISAPTAHTIAGIFAIIGHIFPVFAHFRGGRGVATFIGGMAVICPPVALLGGEVLIIGAGLSGFASLGSLISVLVAYAIMIWLIIAYGVSIEYLYYALFGALIVLIAHRDNINRLIARKERRIGQKATHNTDSSTNKDSSTIAAS